jgi:enamine deaminase RidA (YjgF/YER057c/UK114 family)
MSMESITPDGWPRGAGYAHATAASGRIVSLAGQVGWDPVTQQMADGFVAQTEQALANVATLLTAAGAAPQHLARMTWFITDRLAYAGALKEVGEAYRRVLGRNYPAMSVVVVAALLEPGALVEIEATAVV